MDKFIKANSLRMSSLLPLCAVSSPKHCAMHIALDMLKKNTEAFERRVIELHVKEKEDLQ